MKKITAIIASIITSLTLALSCGAEANSVGAAEDVSPYLKKASAWANKNIVLEAGEKESDMLVIANCKYNGNSAYKNYCADLKDYIIENMDGFGNEEWLRAALTMVCAGGETTLDGDTDIIHSAVFLNDKLSTAEELSWALIIVGEADAKPLTTVVNTADSLIYKLLQLQKEDGSFEGENRVIATAYALNALSYFTKTNDNAKAAVPVITDTLAAMYKNGEITDCRELSAAISGLTSSGINVLTDSRFEGISRKLTKLMNKDGGYGEVKGDPSQPEATIAAYYGLISAVSGAAAKPVTMDEAAGMMGAFLNMFIVLLLIFGVIAVMNLIRKKREKDGKTDE